MKVQSLFAFPVTKIEPYIERNYAGGVGPSALFTETQAGWKVICGPIAFISEHEPDLKVGDMLEIRKVTTLNSKVGGAPISLEYISPEALEPM